MSPREFRQRPAQDVSHLEAEVPGVEIDRDIYVGLDLAEARGHSLLGLARPAMERIRIIARRLEFLIQASRGNAKHSCAQLLLRLSRSCDYSCAPANSRGMLVLGCAPNILF